MSSKQSQVMSAASTAASASNSKQPAAAAAGHNRKKQGRHLSGARKAMSVTTAEHVNKILPVGGATAYPT